MPLLPYELPRDLWLQVWVLVLDHLAQTLQCTMQTRLHRPDRPSDSFRSLGLRTLEEVP